MKKILVALFVLSLAITSCSKVLEADTKQQEQKPKKETFYIRIQGVDVNGVETNSNPVWVQL